VRLAGEREHDAQRGADVAVHRIEDRSRVVMLNETDRSGREIVRRYRMYSYQPDEMLTFMSLASMKPGQGDLDPKLYQYGGCSFIRQGGAEDCFQAGAGRIEVGYGVLPGSSGGVWALYVVVAPIVAAWGFGVWVVFWLIKRLAGGLVVPALGAVGYVLMPWW